MVVGAGAGKDADVFDDSPNITARVQAVAEPDTVMITDATYRLVSGLSSNPLVPGFSRASNDAFSFIK